MIKSEWTVFMTELGHVITDEILKTKIKTIFGEGRNYANDVAMMA